MANISPELFAKLVELLGSGRGRCGRDRHVDIRAGRVVPAGPGISAILPRIGPAFGAGRCSGGGSGGGPDVADSLA